MMHSDWLRRCVVGEVPVLGIAGWRKCHSGELPVGEIASWGNGQLGKVPFGGIASWGKCYLDGRKEDFYHPVRIYDKILSTDNLSLKFHKFYLRSF